MRPLFIGIMSLKKLNIWTSVNPLSRPHTLSDNVKHLCLCNPKESIVECSLELGIPNTTVNNVLHKHFRLFASKI